MLFTTDTTVDSKNINGYTPLHWAAHNGHTACVRSLLAANATVDRQNRSGCTPLLYAATNGHISCVTTLLEANATVEHRSGKTPLPLLWATQNGHTAVADVLRAVLDAGRGRSTQLQQPCLNVWAAFFRGTHQQSTKVPRCTNARLYRVCLFKPVLYDHRWIYGSLHSKLW